jgi:hypothetical protein
MGTWKKSYRSLPPTILAKLEQFNTNDVRVLAGKRITPDEVVAGLYQHLGITAQSLEVGTKWEIVPPVETGTRSKQNFEGWSTIRKDLPKFRKYFYHDIQNFGDGARNGWTTVAIPRDVYEKDVTPPYLFHLEVCVQEQHADGAFGVVFSIDETLSKNAPDFELDLLFALNLLQENTGVSGVVENLNPEFVFTSQLSWDVFPPGNLDDVASYISQQRGPQRGPDFDDVRERLALFEQFQPTEYLRGLGGNDCYIGAKYADDLVVFENLKYGNALYVLYSDWLELSQKPRRELLKLNFSQFDRIVHSYGWETKFAVLMQKELQKRGLRVRIGRNARRRRA